MTTDATPNEPRRRRVARRGPTFSGSGLSQSSHGSGVADGEDEVEAPVEDLNGAVIAAVPPPPPPPPARDPEAALAANTNADEYTPQTRLAEVGRRSSEYEREYRLQLLHRLLLRNLPLDEIAASLGVSVSTVLRDRRELTGRLREAAKELDIDVMIGHSKGFYEEVQAMAMRAASSNNSPLPMRLAAMRTALASHNDMHRFFQAAGVYDTLRFRRGASEGAQSDIQRLMSLTDDLLTEARRDRRTDNALGSFSGDDSEVVDL